MHFSGTIYRALNPVWAAEPLSGAGAARFGGRFNPKGMPALYMALSPVTAMKEANQAGSFQPITLISCKADFDPIFDGRDPAALKLFHKTPADLADPGWRDKMIAKRIAPSQQLALDLIAQGYLGLLVPSFAPGAGADDTNIVLWNWGDTLPGLLTLVDDNKRLGDRPFHKSVP